MHGQGKTGIISGAIVGGPIGVGVGIVGSVLVGGFVNFWLNKPIDYMIEDNFRDDNFYQRIIDDRARSEID